MKAIENNLKAALDTMDVPEGRKEPTIANLRWLQRNLFIRNQNHRELPFAIHMIATLLTLMGENPSATSWGTNEKEAAEDVGH